MTLGTAFTGNNGLKWTARTVFAVAALALAAGSAMNAGANITRLNNPDAALAIDAGQPQALARKADILFYDSQTPKAQAAVEQMAKRALTRQPLNAPAMRLLGYVADLRGDEKLAAKRINMAAKISRRDFGTQLWLIEEAAARNDIKSALVHYDISLRTNVDSRAVLFPTLTDALALPKVQTGLGHYVRNRSIWIAPYLEYAVANAKSPADVVAVISAGGGLPSTSAFAGLDDALLDRLFARGQYDAFGRFYRGLKGAKPALLQSASFDNAAVNPAYRGVGWQVVPGADSGGSFVSAGKDGQQLQVFAGSGTRSTVAVRNLMLAPRNYRFLAQHRAETAAANSALIWTLTCAMADGQRTVLWQDQAALIKGRFAIEGSFSVPATCKAQQLNLVMAGGSDQIGGEATVESVSIR